jgi:hypothetical protein
MELLGRIELKNLTERITETHARTHARTAQFQVANCSALALNEKQVTNKRRIIHFGALH